MNFRFSFSVFKGLLLVSFAGLLACAFYACEAGVASEADAQEISSDTSTAPISTTIVLSDHKTETSGPYDSILSPEQQSFLGFASDDQWLAFEVDIPAPGRYKTEIVAQTTNEGEAVIWIEDYIDNTDGRTYNITSDMVLSDSGDSVEQVVSKDGSPLNAGKHLMKVHLKNAHTYIHSIQFHLLKAHQVTPTTLTQSMEGEQWQVVWSDEFNGTGVPDTSKWTFDIGNWGWGNGELQYYTEARVENARQENGNLIIEARKDDMNQPWTSARLTTRGKVSFVYGKIEFRAKVPPNKGNWAAGWTLGDEYVDEISWPYCGEIDILESVGYQMDDETGDGTAHASAHCGAYYFKLKNQPTATIDVKRMDKEFHTYAVEWTPDYIKAFVDDQHYFTYEDNSSELSWPFSKPQNIILNLAMGGGWGGLEGMDDTVNTQKFIIDYVRVYERK